MIWFKRIAIAAVLLACSVYIFVFCLQNNYLVDVHFVFAQWKQVRIEFLLVLTFISGGLLGLASSAVWWLRMRKKYRVRLYKAERQQKMAASSSDVAASANGR